MSNLKLRVAAIAIVSAAVFAGQASAEDKEKKNNNAQRARPNPNYTPPRSLSPQNLQDNQNLKGIASQNPQGTQLSGNRDDTRPGQGGSDSAKSKLMGLDGEGGQTPGKEGLLGESKPLGGAASQIKSEIGNQGPVTGAKYGDTFGGGRVNNDAQSGGTGNFKGGGKGATSDDPGAATTPSAGGSSTPTTEAMRAIMMEGGVKPGGRKADSGGSVPRSSGDDAGSASGVTSAKDMGSTSYKSGKFSVTVEPPAKKTTTGRERDDSMGSANSTPMGRQDVITNQKGIEGRTKGAGGSGDGRTDQQAAGGGGAMAARDRAEGAVREGGVSNVNMDKALEINQKVNPGRQ